MAKEKRPLLESPQNGLGSLRDALARSGMTVSRGPRTRVLLIDEDFDDPAHESHERFGQRRREHDREFAHIDPAVVGAKLDGAGFAVTTADKTVFAGQPAELRQAVIVKAFAAHPLQRTGRLGCLVLAGPPAAPGSPCCRARPVPG